MTTVQEANNALSKILDSESQENVIELGWIKNVRVSAPRSIITLALPSYANAQRDRIVQEVRKILLNFQDIQDVQIELDYTAGQSNNDENNSHQLQNSKGINPLIGFNSKDRGVYKVTLNKTFFFFITRIDIDNQNHLFFEIKSNCLLPFIREVKCFPPVSLKNGIINSYKSWLKKCESYPIRKKTLLTTIKDGSNRRLNHPLS